MWSSATPPPLRTLLSMMEERDWEPTTARVAPPAQPIIRCSSWTVTLPLEVLSCLCHYLDPASLAALHVVCRPLRAATLKVGSAAWMGHLERTFKVKGRGCATTAYGDYVENHLRRAEIERSSFLATRHLLQTIHSYSGAPGRRGVLGLVGDLGYFETEALARALSKKRSYALGTIVVQNEEVITDFKRKTSASSSSIQHIGATPLTFFPLNAAFNFMTMPFSDALPPLTFPGFLGYAVHLIRLRKEDEFLRHSLFFTIFKNLMVFDTMESLAKYTRDMGEGQEPYACALDYRGEGEADEACGFPRFAYAAPREYIYRDPAVCGALLEAQTRACVSSLAHIRYGM